jgi:hypothetical protein
MNIAVNTDRDKEQRKASEAHSADKRGKKNKDFKSKLH